MLAPNYMDKAGDMVSGVYTQIEADILAYLSRKMLDSDISGQRALTSMGLLSQSTAREVYDIIAKYRHQLDEAVIKTVEDALNRSDKDDLRRIKQGMGKELADYAKTKQTGATILGMQKILERDNVAMAKGAQTAFFNASAKAITQVNTGTYTTERALHEAVRSLNKQGVTMITYRNTKTGQITVQNHVDVAVRRHIRTQISQDSRRLTEIRCNEADVALVEVSSHPGSRDSHQEWEGQIYSRHGSMVVDGVEYDDFDSACQIGDIADGLGGANCNHSYAPWFPGMSRRYSPDPQHPSGETNDDIYRWTQDQRALERDIREAKRDISGIELCLESATGEERTRLDIELASAKQGLRDDQASVRNLVNEHKDVLQRSPRREWAGDKR